MPRAFTPEMAAEISARLKAVGFAYVALDLEGYRQGSLNEALKRPSAFTDSESGLSQT
jgi:pyridinium-3,5-biscarboxylic acid mononucleotide sulfurtransferase